MAKKSNKKQERFFNKELKRNAKKANRRMRELEAADYNSPAYKAVQAQLEMMGVRQTSAKGRRFSESGKAIDQNDLRLQLSVIDKFLNSKTSTRTGFEEYRKQVFESADKTYKFKEHGITQTDYEDLLNSLPDEEDERVYYMTVYVQTMEAYTRKIETDKSNAKTFKEIDNIEENKYSIDELVEIMQKSKDYKSALSKLGLTYKDIKKVRPLK